MEEKTIIERLNENEDILKAMMSMPDSANTTLARKRREHLFGFLWKNGTMDEVEAHNLINKVELDMVREFEDYGLPEWLLRMEAQDLILRKMHEEIVEGEEQ